MKTIISGSYRNTRLLNNKHLVFQDFKNLIDGEIYIANLDGTDKKLLFKNHLIRGPLAISPNGKFLACRAMYIDKYEDYVYRMGCPPPGLSVFVMNLDDKTFTYYMADEIKRYENWLSWYYGSLYKDN